jgi:hypothetical protein
MKLTVFLQGDPVIPFRIEQVLYMRVDIHFFALEVGIEDRLPSTITGGPALRVAANLASGPQT